MTRNPRNPVPSIRKRQSPERSKSSPNQRAGPRTGSKGQSDHRSSSGLRSHGKEDALEFYPGRCRGKSSPGDSGWRRTGASPRRGETQSGSSEAASSCCETRGSCCCAAATAAHAGSSCCTASCSARPLPLRQARLLRQRPHQPLPQRNLQLQRPLHQSRPPPQLRLQPLRRRKRKLHNLRRHRKLRKGLLLRRKLHVPLRRNKVRVRVLRRCRDNRFVQGRHLASR